MSGHSLMAARCSPAGCRSWSPKAAIGQILTSRISLKMIYDPPLPEGFSSLKDYVNSFLPEQIRMWGFVRTMKSFQART